MKASSFQTGNLAAQINDIGVQLAGGQSPFLIALQQGTQINQVLGGSGLRGTVAALGGAFTSLLNPVSLVTIATIGLAGAAVQYFSEWMSGGKATSEEIAKHAALVQKVADKYGVVIPAVKDYADQLTRAADAAERMEAIRLTKDSVAGGFREEFDRITASITDILAIVPDANREFGVLASKIDSNSQTAEDFRRVIDALNVVFEQTGNQTVKSVITQLEALAASSTKAVSTIEELDDASKAVTLTLEEAKTVAAALTTQLLGLGTQGAGAIKEIADAVSGYLNPAMRSVSGYLDGLAKDWEMVGKAQGSAADMIKKHEGFRQTAYWDVNAYRTGFGSDTTTRSDGTIEKVTRDTVVTLADAERDLARRIVEFQSGIQRAIGLDTWRSLSEGQQAALTSIAYNYGSLPKKIVAAIQNGGGPEAVANAIASLGVDNGGVNKTRRRLEAQAYLSSTGYSLKDAGISTSTPRAPKKTPAEIFQGDVDQIQRRIDVLNAEYEAQGRVNPLINDYGFQVEQARIKQELLNEAKKAGVEITPEVSAKINELATNYATASSSVDRLRDSQEKAAEAAREVAEIGRETMGSFIRDMINGKSATEALGSALGRLADRLLNSGLDALFSGGKGGGGGFLGSLLGGIGSLFTKREFGGPVRAGQPYIVGEKRPELFVPNQSGHIVPRIPTALGKSAGGAISAPVNITIDARGADREGLARVEQQVAKLKAELPAHVINTVRQAQKGRQL
nr:phage tail length tape measure family protein [Tianweitania sediminis]